MFRPVAPKLRNRQCNLERRLDPRDDSLNPTPNDTLPCRLGLGASSPPLVASSSDLLGRRPPQWAIASPLTMIPLTQAGAQGPLAGTVG